MPRKRNLNHTRAQSQVRKTCKSRSTREATTQPKRSELFLDTRVRSLILALGGDAKDRRLGLGLVCHASGRLFAERERKGKHRLIFFHRLPSALGSGCGKHRTGRNRARRAERRHARPGTLPRLVLPVPHDRRQELLFGAEGLRIPKLEHAPVLAQRLHLRGARGASALRQTPPKRAAHVQPGEVHVRLASRRRPLRRRKATSTGGRPLAKGARRSSRGGDIGPVRRRSANRACAALSRGNARARPSSLHGVAVRTSSSLSLMGASAAGSSCAADI